MVRKKGISFDGKVWQTGHANVVTVPVQYLKDGSVLHGKEYRISIEEVPA